MAVLPGDGVEIALLPPEQVVVILSSWLRLWSAELLV
jgi:hypothetical protein